MINFKQIFARRNRGILFDVVMFCVQLILMRLLVFRLAEIIDQSKEDVLAKAAVGGFCFALCFLQPAGVLLKRYGSIQISESDDRAYGDIIEYLGCYYFVSQLILIGAGISFIFSMFGQLHIFDYICLGQVVLSLCLASLNVWIIGLYTTPPKHKLLQGFFRLPQVEIFGDLLILLNLILWQMLWGFLLLGYMRKGTAIPNELMWLNIFMPQPEYSMLAKFGWFFLAILVFYLSPRFIYLVHDRRRKLAWLTILLANSPVIYRIIFPPH
jgi:hypothetical protein